MRRREFIAGLGSTTAAWPLAARAQQSGMQRVGILINGPESDAEMQALLAAFRQGFEKLGWSEGRNVRLDVRFAANADRCCCRSRSCSPHRGAVRAQKLSSTKLPRKLLSSRTFPARSGRENSGALSGSISHVSTWEGSGSNFRCAPACAQAWFGSAKGLAAISAEPS